MITNVAQDSALCYGLRRRGGCAEPSSGRAILSPMTVVGMLVLPEVTAGMSDASATYRPSIPCTRPLGVGDRIRIAGRPHLAAPGRVVIVHGSVIEEALDRLPSRDIPARARLPAQQPSQLRRLRHLAHALDAPGEPRAVVSAGVTEIAVIDHEPVIGTGTGQAHAPARERRQACNAEEPEPLRGVLAVAADRVDVQVEPLPASGRRELRDHLLVGPPACLRLMAPHRVGQVAASLVPDLHTRLVVQVP